MRERSRIVPVRCRLLFPAGGNIVRGSGLLSKADYAAAERRRKVCQINSAPAAVAMGKIIALIASQLR